MDAAQTRDNDEAFIWQVKTVLDGKNCSFYKQFNWSCHKMSSLKILCQCVLVEVAVMRIVAVFGGFYTFLWKGFRSQPKTAEEFRPCLAMNFKADLGILLGGCKPLLPAASVRLQKIKLKMVPVWPQEWTFFARDGYYDIIQHFAQPFVTSRRKIELGECLKLMSTDKTMISMSQQILYLSRSSGNVAYLLWVWPLPECQLSKLQCITVDVNFQCILLFRLSVIEPINVILS